MNLQAHTLMCVCVSLEVCVCVLLPPEIRVAQKKS